MSDADTAFTKAKEKIAEAAETGSNASNMLNFNDGDFSALDRLPPEIARLTRLVDLRLANTQITDLAPLVDLADLLQLDLTNTQITDFAPLAGFSGLLNLHLANAKITDLAPFAGLTGLLHLDFANTKITDLRPLAGLSRLQNIYLNDTEITDLRPLAGLDKLGTGEVGHGLRFRGTPATKCDARLAEMAKIKDDRERTSETLAYLQGLPPWPQPYTPAATPDGSPPQPIGRAEDPPKVKTPKAQIRHLLRNPVLTRLTAQQFAGQIKDALRNVPATNGNYLAEPLQTMLEFAEALEHLAPASEPAAAPLEKAKLELRIAQLEELVTRLTQQLQDETNARKAAEALAGKGEFGRSFTKAAGLTAGAAAAGVVTVGVPTAAVYFLGSEHPLIQSFLTVLGRLPK